MSLQNFSVLLLNLDRDTARRAHMEKQLAHAKITFARQPGILGDAVPDDLRPFFYTESGEPKTTMKRGEIGCYASHLRALQRVASGELGYAVLIMEDDLELAPDLIQIIAEAQRAMPLGWDILRLSCPSRRAYVPLAKIGGDRFVVRYSKIPNSAGAYLITPTGAQKFLQQGVRGLTFDDDLRRPWFHHLDTYGIVPPPTRAGMLQSTIDSVEAGRFDKGMSSRMERILRGDHSYMFKRIAYNMRTMGAGYWLACTVINVTDMLVKPIRGSSIIHSATRLFPGSQRHVR
ncbi:MAG: glycosyltransferase family 25 protein [Alphaproteobacteria bacterium]